jgi:hypothetical protein
VGRDAAKGGSMEMGVEETIEQIVKIRQAYGPYDMGAHLHETVAVVHAIGMEFTAA